MDIREKINHPDTILVDVREPLELWLSKIDHAVNIPLRTIPEKVREFKKMNKPVILFCRTGNRSGQAASFLQNQGIRNVYNGGSISEVKHLLQPIGNLS